MSHWTNQGDHTVLTIVVNLTIMRKNDASGHLTRCLYLFGLPLRESKPTGRRIFQAEGLQELSLVSALASQDGNWGLQMNMGDIGNDVPLAQSRLGFAIQDSRRDSHGRPLDNRVVVRVKRETDVFL
jgi:hypothetical protein